MPPRTHGWLHAWRTGYHVVANACTDRTAEIAREAGVRVVEISTPGKANALRLGDAECVTFPRIYVDADIELEFSSPVCSYALWIVRTHSLQLRFPPGISSVRAVRHAVCTGCTNS